MTTLTVGQKLWYVPSGRRHSEPREVTVAKVGRKWATLEHISVRIDVNTLVADGGNYVSPGRCYLNREDYEAEAALSIAWRSFGSKMRDVMYRDVPAGVTVDSIRQAAALLGITMDEAKAEGR